MQPDRIVRLNYEGLAPEYEFEPMKPNYGTCICGYQIQSELDYHTHMSEHALSYYSNARTKKC